MSTNYNKFYSDLLKKLSNCSEAEGSEILRSLVSPQEIRSQRDGVLINIVIRGLSLFNYSAVVQEAGIAVDDPRSKKFKTINGFLVDENYVRKLRNIAAKKDIVASNAGGIPIADRGKFLWWIPNRGLPMFRQEITALCDEYSSVVDDIARDYDNIRQKALDITRDSAAAAWENLSKDPKFTVSKDDYILMAEKRFDEGFVKRSDLYDKICIEVSRSGKPMHSELVEILNQASEDVSSEKDIVMNFFDILEANVASEKTAEIQKIKESFKFDDDISISSKVDVEVVKKLGEICSSLEVLEMDKGKPSMRRVRGIYEKLSQHKGNRASVDRVLNNLRGLMDGNIDETDVNVLRGLVCQACEDIEDELGFEGSTASVAALAKAGEAGKSIEELENLRAGLQAKLAMTEAMKSRVMDYYNM
ncbi:MAG: hypothetical protein IJI14_17650 [Anaerolineaceae bacterium]|nr:hypothetical protein [Anaerolineaceae bacterium]